MTLHQLVFFVLGPLAGYLLGSIPFGWIIGKANGVDIRTVGSKNIGATNLARTLGIRFFWYALILDAAKGFLPVLVIDLYALHHPPELQWTPLLTAAAAILGHLFPLYLGFKGGKGVATSFGAILGIWPIFTLTGLGCLVVFLLVFLGWPVLYEDLGMLGVGDALGTSLWFAGLTKNGIRSVRYEIELTSSKESHF